jgi:hypothetical protein
MAAYYTRRVPLEALNGEAIPRAWARSLEPPAQQDFQENNLVIVTRDLVIVTRDRNVLFRCGIHEFTRASTDRASMARLGPVAIPRIICDLHECEASCRNGTLPCDYKYRRMTERRGERHDYADTRIVVLLGVPQWTGARSLLQCRKRSPRQPHPGLVAAAIRLRTLHRVEDNLRKGLQEFAQRQGHVS